MQEQLISAEEAEELERLYQMPTTYRHVFIPREPEFSRTPILHAHEIITAMLIGSGSALLLLVLIAAALKVWR